MYLELITNIEKLAAATIGDIYRGRWQIEVLFRYLKQNLKIKTFVGTSPIAVLIQVWTALMTMQMLSYCALRHRSSGRCRIWWRCSVGTFLPTRILGRG